MIPANHNKFLVRFSKYYTKILIGIFFGKINYLGHFEEKELPVLIISNHFSFYDGFIQILLNFKVFKRRLHFMMIENELIKRAFLTKVGAFSINKGSRSSIKSLQYTVELLQNKENLVLFFPQGELQSVYTQEFNFEKGSLKYILEKKKNEFQLVFNINLINYGAKLRPDLFVYYETHTISAFTDAEDIEREFNRFAKACFTQQAVL